MGKSLPFPAHKHPPSIYDPKAMLRIGALSNDQGEEGEGSEVGEEATDVSETGEAVASPAGGSTEPEAEGAADSATPSAASTEPPTPSEPPRTEQPSGD